MQRDQTQGEIKLFTNRPLRLNKASGVGVTCTSGTIWITISDDPDDIFLSTGQQYVLTSNQLALVEAIGSGSVRLHPAPHLPGLLAWIVGHRPRFSSLERLLAGNRI